MALGQLLIMTSREHKEKFERLGNCGRFDQRHRHEPLGEEGWEIERHLEVLLRLTYIERQARKASWSLGDFLGSLAILYFSRPGRP